MKKNIGRLQKLAGGPIDAAIVLGSGLAQNFADEATLKCAAFEKFRGMPMAELRGHPLSIRAGEWAGHRVAIFAGRVHSYQGFSADDVTYNVRLAAQSGARVLILTNSAGGLNPAFMPGDIMLITDHLNFTGRNPLIGSDRKDPFIDMMDAYDPELRLQAKTAAGAGTLHEGVYACVPGPTYETAAEARFLRTAGAAAVGMSTVFETIAARACDMRVLAFSVITNMVASKTSHDDVTLAAGQASQRLSSIIASVLQSMR